MKFHFSFNRVKGMSAFGFRKKVFNVWIRHYKLLFMVSFVVLSAFSGYQWYRDVYAYSWNDEQRKAYLDSTAKETAFQEKKFTEALEALSSEAQAHAETKKPARDLFAGARKEER